MAMTVNRYCVIDEIMQQQTLGSLRPYRVAQQSCKDVKRHNSIAVLNLSHRVLFYDVQFVILLSGNRCKSAGPVEHR